MIIEYFQMCVLCPELFGALKETRDGQWVHVSCALAFPQIFFHRPDTHDTIDGLDRIPKQNRLQVFVMHLQSLTNRHCLLHTHTLSFFLSFFFFVRVRRKLYCSF
jgi:hypothetical protein